MEIAFLLLMVVAAGTVKGRAAVDNICICTRERNVVCGTNGVTYSNPCAARCRRVDVAYKGYCKSTKPAGCSCPAYYDPACGTDGKTYDNDCVAKCEGVAVAKQGRCSTEEERSLDPNCACSGKVGPVCGKDGRTYSSACQALCSHVEVRSEGPCEVKRKRRPGTSSVCTCYRPLLSVCGNDGVTHSNPNCATRCGKVTDYVIGACSDVCNCNKKYEPVCHVITGTKYVNLCYAKCLGSDSTQLESCDDTFAIEDREEMFAP